MVGTAEISQKAVISTSCMLNWRENDTLQKALTPLAPESAGTGRLSTARPTGAGQTTSASCTDHGFGAKKKLANPRPGFSRWDAAMLPVASCVTFEPGLLVKPAAKQAFGSVELVPG